MTRHFSRARRRAGLTGIAVASLAVAGLAAGTAYASGSAGADGSAAAHHSLRASLGGSPACA